MKKIIAAFAFGLLLTNVNASVIKVCAKQAEEACKELKDRKEFMQCFNTVRDICMDDIYGGYNKGIPACREYCGTLPEGQIRNLCLDTCEGPAL